MGLKWNFQRGGVIQIKKPSVGGVQIFSGRQRTTACMATFYFLSAFHFKVMHLSIFLKSRPPTSNPGTRRGFGLTSLQMSINPHTLGLSTGKTPTKDDNF